MIRVKIIADSIVDDKRVTTFELEYPRYIHSELLTHRVFSRNCASSRAIPLDKMIELTIDNPVIPIWTRNQKGMSGVRITDVNEKAKATSAWLETRDKVIEGVRKLQELGIHKQNANRLLEPFQHIKTILTGVEFDNLFKLRIADCVQPEFYDLAVAMKHVMEESEPHKLKDYEVHAPYSEKGYLKKSEIYEILKCVALIAQVSYRKENDTEETVKRIVNNLIGHEQIHASPFEHICWYNILNGKGNLQPFQQLRHTIEECNVKTYEELINTLQLEAEQ